MIVHKDVAHKRLCPNAKNNFIVFCESKKCMAWRSLSGDNDKGWCGLGGTPHEVLREELWALADAILCRLT